MRRRGGRLSELPLVTGAEKAYFKNSVFHLHASDRPNPSMKSTLRPLALLAAALLAGTSLAQAETTIAYPTADDATFTIIVPDNWELSQAESEDDYFLITGPTNTELWFRAFPVKSEEELEGAVEDAMTSGAEWLGEHYKGLDFGDVAGDGMPFISLPGKGIEKESGEAVIFTIAFILMENGSMAEFWGIIPDGDAKGQKAAQAIVDSFEPQ
jgi:hypothetical protein